MNYGLVHRVASWLPTLFWTKSNGWWLGLWRTYNGQLFRILCHCVWDYWMYRPLYRVFEKYRPSTCHPHICNTWTGQVLRNKYKTLMFSEWGKVAQNFSNFFNFTSMSFRFLLCYRHDKNSSIDPSFELWFIHPSRTIYSVAVRCNLFAINKIWSVSRPTTRPSPDRIDGLSSVGGVVLLPRDMATRLA